MHTQSRFEFSLFMIESTFTRVYNLPINIPYAKPKLNAVTSSSSYFPCDCENIISMTVLQIIVDGDFYKRAPKVNGRCMGN